MVVFLRQIICCAAVQARKRFLKRNTVRQYILVNTYDYILYDYVCTSKHLHSSWITTTCWGKVLSFLLLGLYAALRWHGQGWKRPRINPSRTTGGNKLLLFRGCPCEPCSGVRPGLGKDLGERREAKLHQVAQRTRQNRLAVHLNQRVALALA